MIQDLKLTINDKELKFTFGILFIGEVLERLDVDYNTMLQKVSKNPFKYAPILMYESLLNTAKRDNTDIDFTETDLVTWLENEKLMGVEIMLEFIGAFMGTNENKTPIKTNEKETVKKK